MATFSAVDTSQVRVVFTRNGGTAVGMTEFEAWGPAEDMPSPAASDNLALNVDAWKYPRLYPSFAYIRHSAFQANDGDADTYWSTQKSRNGVNEFLRMDFGESTTLNTVTLDIRTAPVSMNLEYLSADSWVAVPNVQKYPATPATGLNTLTFPAIDTDQLRVNFETSGVVVVKEIEIYETEASSDATLRILRLSSIELDFTSTTGSYAVAVPVETTDGGAWVEITPVDDDGDADNGYQVRLAVGENTIEVLVTAQDGMTEKTYTVTVNRAQRWSAARAREWGEEHGWLVGANYIPRYAINQLEHWQADTFDIDTIDEELGWAADLGMNVMRVYLHDLLYREDSAGLLDRVGQYLKVSDSHDIATILVLLDDVWNPDPKSGTQPAPMPGVHNSGWVQSPGRAILGDLEAHDSLKPYVEGVIAHFDGDERVIAFELYNEPGNRYPNFELPNKATYSLALLQKAFQWARAANPAQPVFNSGWHSGTWSNASGEFVGWDNLDEIDRFAFEHSDIIGFHGYSGIRTFRAVTEVLSGLFDRPVIATEYMARPFNTFERMLPVLKKHGVGAINWGLVSGKSQTIYPWSTWTSPNPGEPDPWFHDVLKPNCVPYDPDEAALIRQLTGTPGANQVPVFRDGTNPARSMSENAQAGAPIGIPIAATDGDGGTLTYSLKGRDTDSFTIVSHSGQLQTKSGVSYDHEAPDDYSVTVRVEDGQCGAATIGVTISVTDAPGTVTLPPMRPQVESALTATVKDFDFPVSVSTWRWARSEDGEAIEGATTATYTPRAADSGHYLHVTATYTDRDGTSKDAVGRTAESVAARPTGGSEFGGGAIVGVAGVGVAGVAVAAAVVAAAAVGAAVTTMATRPRRRPRSALVRPPPGVRPRPGSSTPRGISIISDSPPPTPACWSSRRSARPIPWAPCGKTVRRSPWQPVEAYDRTFGSACASKPGRW